MNAKPKTMEEHLDYLLSMIRLKLFFLARWQHTHPKEDFSFTLRERVDIFRKTDLNPEALTPVGKYFELPQWRRLEDRLRELPYYPKHSWCSIRSMREHLRTL